MPVIKTSPLSGASTTNGTGTLSTNFKNQLFQFLETKGIENLIPYVYNDNKGIPTLGAGYALVVEISGVWQVRKHYQQQLVDAGIHLSLTQSTVLHNDLADAAAYLNNPNGSKKKSVQTRQQHFKLDNYPDPSARVI